MPLDDDMRHVAVLIKRLYAARNTSGHSSAQSFTLVGLSPKTKSYKVLNLHWYGSARNLPVRMHASR